MPSYPLLHAFSLIRASLPQFDPRQVWPTEMVELQRFVFDLHPELVEGSPALQWAQKAVQPWPTTENWRQHERGEYLRRAAALVAEEEVGLTARRG